MIAQIPCGLARIRGPFKVNDIYRIGQYGIFIEPTLLSAQEQLHYCKIYNSLLSGVGKPWRIALKVEIFIIYLFWSNVSFIAIVQ